jgi:hypothetical protein
MKKQIDLNRLVAIWKELLQQHFGSACLYKAIKRCHYTAGITGNSSKSKPHLNPA